MENKNNTATDVYAVPFEESVDMCSLEFPSEMPSLQQFSRRLSPVKRSLRKGVPFSRVRKRLAAHRAPRSPRASQAKPMRKLERLIQLERRRNRQETALRQAALKNATDARSKFVFQTVASQGKRTYRHDDRPSSTQVTRSRRPTKPVAPRFQSARRAKLRSERAATTLAKPAVEKKKKKNTGAPAWRKPKATPTKPRQKRKLTKPQSPKFATAHRQRASSAMEVPREAPTPAAPARTRARSQARDKRVVRSQPVTKRKPPPRNKPTKRTKRTGGKPNFMRGTVTSSIKNLRHAQVQKKKQDLEAVEQRRREIRPRTRRPPPKQRGARAQVPSFRAPIRQQRQRARAPPPPPRPARRTRPRPPRQPVQPRAPPRRRPPVQAAQPKVTKRRGSKSRFTFGDAEIDRMLQDDVTSVCASDALFLPTAEAPRAEDLVVPGADAATMLCLKEKLDQLDSLFIEISEKMEAESVSFDLSPSRFILGTPSPVAA